MPPMVKPFEAHVVKQREVVILSDENMYPVKARAEPSAAHPAETHAAVGETGALV